MDILSPITHISRKSVSLLYRPLQAEPTGSWKVRGSFLYTITFIRSSSAFDQARFLGRLDVLKARIFRKNPYLLSFNDYVDFSKSHLAYQGLKDIPTPQVLGSAGRAREYSRNFYPLARSKRQIERWRNCYTMIVSGAGYAPIEVVQIGRVYFVISGHQRVSVARYLNWRMIQAYVSVLDWM